VGIGFLSLGTVVKRKDAIELTKTDPIAYEQKKKEEAEGKKGPPVPALKLYPREKFQVEPPVGKEKEREETEKETGPEEEPLDWEEWFEEEEAPELGDADDEGGEPDKRVKPEGSEDDTSGAGMDFVY